MSGAEKIARGRRRVRPSIALIGPDGAGKTTIGRMVEQSGVLPCKYLYMGISTSSSNLALPTSRMVELIKPFLRARGRDAERRENGPDTAVRDRSGALWGAARLVNRLLEAWFRQFVSWYYQARGFAVVYDRHFAFDFAPDVVGDAPEPLGRRLYRWCVTRLYPRPDMVIFLDAPGEVLFARKHESTVQELERRRQAFLRQGARLTGFVRVDATRPLAEVYQDVSRRIVGFCGGGMR